MVQSSCLYRASTVLRHYFIIPNWCTQLQNHRNIKTIKILTIALTCFGSRRNHLQGAVWCLAKTTYDSMCSSLLTWSMSWRPQFSSPSQSSARTCATIPRRKYNTRSSPDVTGTPLTGLRQDWAVAVSDRNAW